MLEEHKCFQIFGVIRRDALERTGLIGRYAHGDGVLLAHLALLGRFVEIPEYLFLPRRHPEHSMRMIGDYWSYAAWFDPAHGRKLIFPHCADVRRVSPRRDAGAAAGSRPRRDAGRALGRVLR